MTHTPRQLAWMGLAVVATIGLPEAAQGQGWAVFAAQNKVFRTTVGGNPEVIYDGQAAHACWSARGQYVYFIKNNGELWRMSNDGSSPRKLASGLLPQYSPIAAYRPDPEYVLYAEHTTFYKVHGTTGQRTVLYKSGATLWEGEIAISQDGKRLAGRGGARRDLYRIDLASSSPRDIVYDTNCSSSISPDGTLLTANIDGHRTLGIVRWNGSSVDCEKDGSCHKIVSAPSGVEWDNQRFAVNSNDWVIYRHDDNSSIGVVQVSTNQNKLVCRKGPTYPDFFYGDIPKVVAPPPVNQAPSATISAPKDGASFQPGDRLSYSGSATDPEDGTLSGSSLSWAIDAVDDGKGPVHTSSGTSGSYLFPSDVQTDVRYTVALTATDSQGLLSTRTISVWLRPTATPVNVAPAISEVSANPSPVAPNETVTFSCRASDPDGDPLAYTWDFADGSSGNGASVQHRFANEGAFTVTVRVSDGQGHQVQRSIEVQVRRPTSDTLDPEPTPSSESVVIEAEEMQLDGYHVEGTLIATMSRGIATTAFPGDSALYRVRVVIIREDDGRPTLTVSVAGDVLAAVVYDMGGSSRDPQTVDLGVISIRQGDRIELIGELDQGAAARVDKLLFDRVGSHTTDPVSLPSADSDRSVSDVADSPIPAGATPIEDPSRPGAIDPATNGLNDAALQLGGGCHLVGRANDGAPAEEYLLLFWGILLGAAGGARARAHREDRS